MPTVTLTIQSLNLMMGYLAKRPWGEVNSIINAVHNEVGPQVAPKKIKEPDQAVGGTD